MIIIPTLVLIEDCKVVRQSVGVKPKSAIEWKYREVCGNYMVRENRELAIKAGFPIEYDRLALMATSVYYLPHWHNNVSIANYILQVAKFLYDMDKELYETAQLL